MTTLMFVLDPLVTEARIQTRIQTLVRRCLCLSTIVVPTMHARVYISQHPLAHIWTNAEIRRLYSVLVTHRWFYHLQTSETSEEMTTIVCLQACKDKNALMFAHDIAI